VLYHQNRSLGSIAAAAAAVVVVVVDSVVAVDSIVVDSGVVVVVVVVAVVVDSVVVVAAVVAVAAAWRIGFASLNFDSFGSHLAMAANSWQTMPDQASTKPTNSVGVDGHQP